MPGDTGARSAVLGERAFEAELDRVVARIAVSDESGDTRDLSEAIAKVENAVAGRDFFQAIRLLADFEITLAPRRQGTSNYGVLPEDVEQALGDLRRATERASQGECREAARALCAEARQAAGEGRWEAAWAIIDEADQRLAGLLTSTPSSSRS